MTDQPPQEAGEHPRMIGPTKRWLVLLAWAGCLAGVLAAQRLAADMIPTGHFTLDGSSLPTAAERVWFLLSPTMVVVFTVLFYFAARRLVPEAGTRSLIRAWGILLGMIALMLSVGMGCCFNILWYLD